MKPARNVGVVDSSLVVRKTVKSELHKQEML